MAKNILVVAPHPDDESLGCGGVILKHKSKGDHVSWCIVTTMVEDEVNTKATINSRENEISSVQNAYGIDKLFRLGYPTTMLIQLSYGQLVNSAKEVIEEVKPEVIYLPYPLDVHSDHRITFSVFFSCTKNYRAPSIRKIFSYETLSETNYSSPSISNVFVPNYFIDITEHFEKKMEILSIYKTEMEEHPFPRNPQAIEALAILRGSTCGSKYAEAFYLHKAIE